jgi:hypothetical protein
MTAQPQALCTGDLVGTWGFDTGYEVRPDEVRIVFSEDNTGTINPHADAISFEWKYEPDEGLSMFVDSHWYGPFKIQITDRDLPLGRFTSLISSGPLLPFGLKEFQRMPDSSEPRQ